MSHLLRQRVSNTIVISKAIPEEASVGENVGFVVQWGAISILPSVKKKGGKFLIGLEGRSSRGDIGPIHTQNVITLQARPGRP